MKTVKINKLCIGINNKNEFCLGLYNKDNQCLYEILIRGKNITIGKNPIPLVPWGLLSRIIFQDYTAIGEKFPDIEIYEDLIREWATKIKTDEINSVLKEIYDGNSKVNLSNSNATQLFKKELLISALTSYNSTKKEQVNESTL